VGFGAGQFPSQCPEIANVRSLRPYIGAPVEVRVFRVGSAVGDPNLHGGLYQPDEAGGDCMIKKLEAERFTVISQKPFDEVVATINAAIGSSEHGGVLAAAHHNGRGR